MMKLLFKNLIVLFLISNPGFSQDNGKDEKWDINDPVEPFKEVIIETDEGTWMNLDVSPDGKTIVFDMLGDIYVLPITGGEAKLLREGHAFEIQPRFSPDGKSVLFTSDAGGGDNIWMMNADGSKARQVTNEDFRLLNNAVWTPDGQYLVARKHFTSERSLGAGEMWMYHIGGGEGVQLTKRKNDQQDAGEPWVSPDGRYVYFSEDMAAGGMFLYNKDPNSQIYVIRRYDRKDGTVENVIQGPGGAIRPQISPDGKKLAFIRRVRTKSVLYIHDLATGIQTPVYDQLSKDQQEVWAIFGVYPNYGWMPDNEHIVIWAKGKIRKVNIESGEDEIIPFKAKAKHKITNALFFDQNPAPDEFKARVIRHACTSPDGKTLAFNAAGYLYLKNLPDGKPKRLTDGKDLEFEPSFSPDGKSVVYVTWNDEEKGAIWKTGLKGEMPQKITSDKGMYRQPSYSPDGSQIVYFKEGGNSAMGYSYSVKPGIYCMNSNGDDAYLITKDGQNPAFNKSGDRIFYQKGGFLFGALDKSYCSVDLNGEDKKVHFHSKYANQFTLSPDNKWLAFGELYHVYVVPFVDHGQTFELNGNLKSMPITKVSDGAGINLQWSNDGQKLHWTLGSTYNTVELKNCFTFLEGAPDSIGEVKKEIIDVDLTLNTDKPSGKLAFTGARILTMNGDQIIENGVLVVEENRIASIGSPEEVRIPNDAIIIDVSGKVIMPGIIDTHAHLNAFRYGLSPQKEWPYYANLAYGVTSTHDPSSNSEMSLSQSEMVKAGHMVGPRIFTTGTILYGAEGDFKAVINSYEDAKFAIERTKAYGAFSVKSYNQPRRTQRQQVIKAAKELEIMVYPEGGSTFFHNMTMILDGHTSIEHNVPVAPLYNDVIRLWSASKTANTPTLIVNYGGLNGEYYWYQYTNVWEEEKLLKYTPRAVIDSRSRHRTMAPEEEYVNGHILTSKSCKKLVDAGVKVCVGGHGQLQGLGVLWEMWNLSQGGMTNKEVLRAATIHGAHYIGMGDHLGSILPGKLADFIILDEDPTEDIKNINSVIYTVINGRMYDTGTMNEMGNYDRPRGKFFWEQEGYNDNFEWHAGSHSFTGIRCSCRQ
ncbi:MAG: amidohydrolase family protein [Cytophagales bacterium]|nr:amidohydrolase family protein [Cytophagales bacterium]